MLNLLTATKSLIHFVWEQPQDRSCDSKIRECVEVIRHNAAESDAIRSLDPIAFISVFVTVLYGVVPRDVVGRHKDKIYDVMGKLADIIMSVDEQVWTISCRRCARGIDPEFWTLYLQQGIDSPSSISLYLGFALLQAKSYHPSTKDPVTSETLDTLIHLMKENPTSLVFAFLIMHSIRYRTLTDNPNSFNCLFNWLSDSEKSSHGIGMPLISPHAVPQLTRICRGPILIEPTHCNEIPYPVYLEPTTT